MMKFDKRITGVALFAFSLYESFWFLYKLNIQFYLIWSLLIVLTLMWGLLPSKSRVFLPWKIVIIPNKIRFVSETLLYLFTFLFTWFNQNHILATLFLTLCLMSAVDNWKQIKGLWLDSSH